MRDKRYELSQRIGDHFKKRFKLRMINWMHNSIMFNVGDVTVTLSIPKAFIIHVWVYRREDAQVHECDNLFTAIRLIHRIAQLETL